MDIDIMNQKPKPPKGTIIREYVPGYLIVAVIVSLILTAAILVTTKGWFENNTYPTPPVIITVHSDPLPDTARDEINKAIQDEQFDRAFNTFRNCMLDTNHKQTAEECKQQFWNTGR